MYQPSAEKVSVNAEINGEWKFFGCKYQQRKPICIDCENIEYSRSRGSFTQIGKKKIAEFH